MNAKHSLELKVIFSVGKMNISAYPALKIRFDVGLMQELRIFIVTIKTSKTFWSFLIKAIALMALVCRR